MEHFLTNMTIMEEFYEIEKKVEELKKLIRGEEFDVGDAFAEEYKAKLDKN